VARLRQAEFDPTSALRGGIIDSRLGSSLGAIKEALLRAGIDSEVLAFDEVAGLSARLPAICLVRSTPDAAFDHYVVVFRIGPSSVSIFNPPGSLLQSDPDAFARSWSGFAIVPRDKHREARIEQLSGLALAVVAAGVAALVLRRMSGWRSFLMAALIALMSSVGFGFGRLAGVPPAARVGQGAGATQAYTVIPAVVAAEDLNRLTAGNAEVLIIDVRPREQFETGHIPNAVNAPFRDDVIERVLQIADGRRSIKVIVYCQSERCPSAAAAGTALMRGGFASVRVLKGGYEAWLRARS